MVAQSAYAQVFHKLGILAGSKPKIKDNTPQIKVVAGTSGSSWFWAQFAFSKRYYNSIVLGTPKSLGKFTLAWMNAYATTQANISTSCVEQLQPFCDAVGGELADGIPLVLYYNESWPQIVYAMFDAASATYNDPNMVSVEASYEDKILQMAGVDVCFHTSILPNARAKVNNTITYLAKDFMNASSSYTVPLPYDYCVGDNVNAWLPGSFPGGNVYNINSSESFNGSDVSKGFPMYPPVTSDGLYVTPQLDKDTAITLSPKQMSPPFGGLPTALQISVASSSTVGYISEEVASYFAQFVSIVDFGIQNDNSLTAEKRAELKGIVKNAQDFLWSTGLLANAATMGGWTKPNPATMPPADAKSYWFTDGGYTDGVSSKE